MAWQPTFPKGSVSVKANETIGQDNTDYTKTTMNVDHFWDGDGTEDGHHQFAQMPKFESAPGVPGNPAIATGVGGVFYSKDKTAAEAPGGVDVQPFFENTVAAVDQIMQLLAVRAMAVINVSAAGVLSTVYLHNCTIAHNHGGAETIGRFTMTFDVDLPTANYMFYGGGITRDVNTSHVLLCNINGGTDDGLPQKTKSRVLIKTQVLSGSSGTKTILDPLQAYFVVFGG